MKKDKVIYVGLFFAIIVVASNYLVQFKINDWITWGAILFPIGFLATDIISEKYGKDSAVKSLRYGILFAFIPTMIIVDARIAIASLFAYFISQYIDIIVFVYLKNRYKNLWWLRNNVSTLVSQFADSFLFFFIAFYGQMNIKEVVMLAIGTILTKYIIAIIDTPIFYAIAIRR